MNTTTLESKGPGIEVIKARQKAMWESGDFGQIARHITPAAEQFMEQLPLKPGMRVLDVACGTGNLAVIAARRGCVTSGVDIAANLIAQARERARMDALHIQFTEGDAEQLPYADGQFDAVVSMYGAMFAPRPELAASELFRVTRPGGFVAMANWTPEGFVGKMFQIFKAHVPPPPGIPSPLLWGDEATVRERLKGFSEIRLARRIAVMRYPFGPAETVEFFRRYFGPTGRAFDSLDAAAQEAFRQALVKFQTAYNMSAAPNTTEVHGEYLQVIARR
jgi:ubiquinone/menaquinone biosynthesis C-methylase UbiE